MINPDIVVTHIRSNIQKKIKEAGYPSVERFAYENGLIKTTISRAINGSRNPRLVTLVEIANALEIPLHELLELEKIGTVKNTGTGKKIADKK